VGTVFHPVFPDASVHYDSLVSVGGVLVNGHLSPAETTQRL
jgi:hypothetical protein